MAAISLIAGSVIGWIAFAVALTVGSLLSTAFLICVATSLICSGGLMLLSHHQSHP